MNWEKIINEIEELKREPNKIRQSFVFDEKLYKEFEKAVGAKNVGKALSVLMKAFLDKRG